MTNNKIKKNNSNKVGKIMNNNQIKQNNSNKVGKIMNTEIKNINEEKLETETTINKEESTKNNNPELVKCPCCGKMVNPNILRKNEPLCCQLICPECEANCGVTFRHAVNAYCNEEYVDRLAKKTVKLILPKNVRVLTYVFEYFDYFVIRAISKFLNYEWSGISNEEKEANMLALRNHDREIIGRYESPCGDLTLIMDKCGDTLTVYFSDVYEASKYWFENKDKLNKEKEEIKNEKGENENGK